MRKTTRMFRINRMYVTKMIETLSKFKLQEV